MNNVNQTLYIPLYGKAYVSKRGLFLHDVKAEAIWAERAFPLRRKAKSKWLAYYMGIRAAVFDDWLKRQLATYREATVVHIGCGLDSRVLRVPTKQHVWYDIDFADVIAERRRYYEEHAYYKMLAGDVRQDEWLHSITETRCTIVVLEGVSMYLKREELRQLFARIAEHFEQVVLLVDCYSEQAAKWSRYKNPVHAVGVTEVYGLDDPHVLDAGGMEYSGMHAMTPQRYIDELHGYEKLIFATLYAGRTAKKLYQLFEYRKDVQ